MKRLVPKLLLFLFVAAIINVAVAWGCVEFSSRIVREVSPSPAQTSFWTNRWKRELHPYVEAYVETGFGVESFLSDCIVGGPHNSSEAGATNQLIAGVPMRCLTGNMTITRLPPSEAGNQIVGLQFVRCRPEIPGWGSRRRFYHSKGFRAFPSIPIWPGFAINTIFYAAILWLPFAAIGAFRRRRRIKRGLCPKCGYDLRGSTSQTCPECGATASKPS